jgi:eukaryotic-like serine/threonine-protein kinase
VAVPNVVGSSLPSAESQLRTAGFTVGSVTGRRSATVPKRDVISTSPSPGANASRGTPINIVYSVGTGTVSVPYVQGDSLSTAESTLQKAGLVPVVVHMTAPAGTPAGQVWDQHPAANTQVAVGTKVTIDLPPNPVTVPNVVGQTAADATALLSGNPYNFSVTSTPASASANCSPGDVCSTSPAVGSTAEPGQTITIFVGTATATTPPPSSPPPSPSGSPSGSPSVSPSGTPSP